MSKPSEIAATKFLAAEKRGLVARDRNVKVLGVVSLLNDLSSDVAVRTLRSC